ncbi:MAG: hypothetical protein ACO3A2_09615 [Bdellovibrionia bacterium]
MIVDCQLWDLLSGVQKDQIIRQYGPNVLDRISIQGLIDEFKAAGGKNEDLVDPVWFGDSRDQKVYYLMKCDDGFEVFLSEKGGKHWRKTFRNLDEAVFDLVDVVVNGYGFLAVDTKIE